MPNGPDRINPEIALAAASFVLALIAYLRPPDPAHPTRFDFLSRSISVPSISLRLTKFDLIVQWDSIDNIFTLEDVITESASLTGA
jgi:hypothetical protein